MSAAALEVAGLAKSFAGVPALHPLEWTVEAGEVHALIGQNGCGKSTLVKCLTGYHRPDGGEASVFGERLPMPVLSPASHGIAVIHQDVGLVESMTVLENLGANARYGTRLLQPVRVSRERRIYTELFERLGLAIPLSATVADLSPAEHALIGIVRAMRLLTQGTDRNLFILDEPTAYLSRTEARRITDFMRRVADLGSSVVFISHRLGEVLESADAITVLRDGHKVATHGRGDVGRHDLVAEMLGHRLTEFYPEPTALAAGAAPVMSVRGLGGRILTDVAFDVRRGEILGVTGLAGMGQEELPMLVAGATTPAAGSVSVTTDRGTVDITHRLHTAISSGVSLVPGNRHRDGCWLDGSATENVTLPSLASLRGPTRQIRRRQESEVAMRLLTLSGVRPLAPGKPLRELSGGNQQKVVLSKWLNGDPRLLVLDEPTQGVDAGAAKELLEHVTGLAERGAAVILCSGDYEQIAAVCHRALVLAHGQIVAELTGADLTEAGLLQACESDGGALATQ
ncbi:MAG TPA: sugar ABC transporter ATP-binding protein [Marmoricola sp.]|jgi:ribose transport system ATP-binding protein|nr:sugar ABC transporter ATP-binding protein [Marmoricola sp.]